MMKFIEKKEEERKRELLLFATLPRTPLEGEYCVAFTTRWIGKYTCT